MLLPEEVLNLARSSCATRRQGAEKAQGKSFRFANFISSQLLAKIVERESPGSEFAQEACRSCLFAFRVPSEAPQLRRAYADDPLLVFAPQREKAIIGVRLDGDEPFLVAKLSWRKNFPGDCILRRPCFCGLTNATLVIAQQLFLAICGASFV